MEVYFEFFQKAKPSLLTLNPNLIDCCFSGLTVATLMKYNQHILQGSIPFKKQLVKSMVGQKGIDGFSYLYHNALVIAFNLNNFRFLHS